MSARFIDKPRVRTYLLFSLCGPGIGAIPFVLFFGMVGLVENGNPALALVTLLVSYPIGILPATLAGFFYFSLNLRYNLADRRRRAGLVLGLLSGLLSVIASVLVAGLLIGYQEAFNGVFSFIILICGTISGGVCGALEKHLNINTL